MTDVKNIDNLIVSDMQQKVGVTPITPPIDPVSEQQPEPEKVEDTTKTVETQNKEPDQTPKVEEKVDDKIDEYGNPVEPQEKQKVYTEEEVQRMIRERLARGKHTEQQSEPIKQQNNDESNEEDWRVTLKNEVKNINQELERERHDQQWRQQETERQADFEHRFTSGMEKYSDFKQVIAGKSITDTMMMATRSLENPAAFIYGAAKTHPQELERISKISDPFAQASEVGRLHERMIKDKKLVSNAPRPLETINGDMPTKDYTAIPIDQRIIEHAKTKRR